MLRFFCLKLAIGPLHNPVTWCKITYTGKQFAHWDFENNAPAFVLEVPLYNLLTSIFNFAPRDRVCKGPIVVISSDMWKLQIFKTPLVPMVHIRAIGS